MKAKKILNKAEELGFTKFRLVTLYTQPQEVVYKFRKGSYSNVSDAIRDYIIAQDPTIIHNGKTHMRSFAKYYLATNIKLYVELFDGVKGFRDWVDPRIHVEQINIYCDNDESIRDLANLINSLWEKNPTQEVWAITWGDGELEPRGMLVNLDWEKIEKKFKVNRDDCISTWNFWLQEVPKSLYSSFNTPPAPYAQPSSSLTSGPKIDVEWGLFISAVALGLIAGGICYYVLCWYILNELLLIFRWINELLFIDAILILSFLYLNPILIRDQEGKKIFDRNTRGNKVWITSIGLGIVALIEGILFSIWALSMVYPWNVEYFLLLAIGTTIGGILWINKGIGFYQLHRVYSSLNE